MSKHNKNRGVERVRPIFNVMKLLHQTESVQVMRNKKLNQAEMTKGNHDCTS